MVDKTEEASPLEGQLEAEVEKRVAARMARAMELLRHEMRTPVGSVLTLCDLIAQEPDAETVKTYLDGVRQSAHTALSVLQASNMAEAVTIEAMINGADTSHAPSSLKAFLAPIRAYHCQKAQEKGLNFTLDVEETAPEVFSAPLSIWRQILDNLLNNAIKFTSDGSVRLMISADSQSLILTVEDTGPGMSAEEQATLFDAYARSKHVQSIEGAGIGLAVVKGLVEKIGGALRLRSEIGVGTAFQIVLPFEAAAEPAKREETHSPIKRSRSILVVEDNRINRMLIETLLDKFGHHIAMASSGEEALTLASEQSFDLVLMDIEMPGGMNGFETTRALRGLPGWVDTPVIALSAHDGPETEKLVAKNKMASLVSKPLSARCLYYAIETAVTEADKAKRA